MSAEAALRVVIAGARAAIEPGGIARRAGGPEKLLAASPERLERLGLPESFARELRRARRADVAAFRAELAESGTVCVTLADAAYPAALRELHDPPLAVFLRGALREAPLPAPAAVVAIVGARRPTDAGLRIARRLGAFARRSLLGLGHAGPRVVAWINRSAAADCIGSSFTRPNCRAARSVFAPCSMASIRCRASSRDGPTVVTP